MNSSSETSSAILVFRLFRIPDYVYAIRWPGEPTRWAENRAYLVLWVCGFKGENKGGVTQAIASHAHKFSPHFPTDLLKWIAGKMRLHHHMFPSFPGCDSHDLEFLIVPLIDRCLTPEYNWWNDLQSRLSRAVVLDYYIRCLSMTSLYNIMHKTASRVPKCGLRISPSFALFSLFLIRPSRQSTSSDSSDTPLMDPGDTLPFIILIRW